MANKVLVFVVFLFLVGLASAADFEIDLLRESYAGYDSVQVMILNNLTLINDVGFSNIKLYGENRIPLSLSLHKTDYGYFVFFNLPGLSNGTYSFVVEDLSYVEEGVLKKESFSKDLVVEDLNYSLSLYPMFVSLDLDYWERPRLTFNLKNHFDDVNVSFVGNDFIKPRVDGVSLKKNDEYSLVVDIIQDAVEGFDVKGDLIIDYGFSYEIPIYIHKKLKGQLIENKTAVEEIPVVIKEGLRFIEDVDRVNRTLKNDTVLEGALRFKNFANITLHGLKFNLTNGLDDVIRLEYNDLDFIDKDEQKYVILFVNEDKSIDKDYEGSLLITTKEGVGAEFPIYLYYEEEIKEDVEKEEPMINYTEFLHKEEKESNLLLYIVIVVFIGLLIVVASYFYRKSKPKERKFEELFR